MINSLILIIVCDDYHSVSASRPVPDQFQVTAHVPFRAVGVFALVLHPVHCDSMLGKRGGGVLVLHYWGAPTFLAVQAPAQHIFQGALPEVPVLITTAVAGVMTPNVEMLEAGVVRFLGCNAIIIIIIKIKRHRITSHHIHSFSL